MGGHGRWRAPLGGDAPGDPLDLGQSLGTRSGRILRIDPLDPDRAGPRRCANPPDDPFVGQPGRDDIWAYGLRNPWRFSFDRLLGDLWIGEDAAGELYLLDLRGTLDRLEAVLRP